MNEHPELGAGDMLEIQAHPAYRLGYEHGWDDAPRPPAPRRRDRLGIVAVVAAGLALLLAGIAIGRADAAPRAAQTTERFDVSAPSSAGQLGVPRDGDSRVPLSAAALRGQTSPVDRGTPPPPSAIGNPLQGVQGLATWYCCTRHHPSGLYAAAGPALRVGHWRGRVVTVCSPGGCVRVRLIDWCLCGHGRVVDLYPQAFRRLAPLSVGIVGVTVSWGGSVAPPATDVEP